MAKRGGKAAGTMDVIGEEGPGGWDMGEDEEDAGGVLTHSRRAGAAVTGVRGALARIYANPPLFDALVYAAFLCLLAWVALGARDQPYSQYKRNSRPQESLAEIQRAWEVPFMNVSTPQGWFDFMQEDFISLLFPIAWYSGQAIETKDLGFAGDRGPGTLRVMGAVSVRQVRVQINSCSKVFAEDLATLVPWCVGEYRPQVEDQNAFGPLVKGLPRYAFTSDTETSETDFTGLAATYQGSGFRVLLPADGLQATGTKANATIAQLRADRWISRQTRAIIVTLNLYCPTTNYITTVRLLTEFPASGGMWNTAAYRHVSMGHLFLSQARTSTLWAEVLLVVALFGYAGAEANKILSKGFGSYFSSWWGVLEWMIFGVFCAAYSLRYAALEFAKTLAYPPDEQTFVNFDLPTYFIVCWRGLLGFVTFLSFIKMYKHLRFLPFLTRLIKIVFRSLIDSLYLGVAVVAAWVGFALAHFLAYGDLIAEYRTLPRVMMMLWRQALGDLKGADEMVRQNKVLGAGFLVAWTLTATLLLLNLFLVLIVNSFRSTEHSKMENASLFGFLKQKSRGVLRKVAPHRMLIAEEEAAGADAMETETILEREVGDQEDEAERMPATMAEEEERLAVARSKALRRGARREVLLQSLGTISREARVLSRRLKTLSDTDAPVAAAVDDFFQ